MVIHHYHLNDDNQHDDDDDDVTLVISVRQRGAPGRTFVTDSFSYKLSFSFEIIIVVFSESFRHRTKVFLLLKWFLHRQKQIRQRKTNLIELPTATRADDGFTSTTVVKEIALSREPHIHIFACFLQMKRKQDFMTIVYLLKALKKVDML